MRQSKDGTHIEQRRDTQRAPALAPWTAGSRASVRVSVRRLRHGREPSLEGRIELMIVAGDFLTGGNIADGEALLEMREIGVRRLTVIHEAAIIGFQDPEARFSHVRIRIACDEVLHVGWKFFDIGLRKEDIEFRLEPPDYIARFNGLSSVNAYSLDRTIREIGANKHHDLVNPNRVVRLIWLL